jgi:hypothetical protein
MILGWNGIRRMTLLAAAVVAVSVSVASGQTPVATCGADSLYLFSPDQLGMALGSGERSGLVLSWPDLNPDEATCFALTDADGLGYEVTASGGFGDRVDRQLLFSATESGPIGGVQPENLFVNWSTEGSSAFGRLTGVINLSNNGGVWTWDGATTWTQSNQGLPITWRQANVVALAKGAGGMMVGGFTRGSSLTADPAGVYVYADGAWTRIGADIFDGNTLVTHVAVSPNSNSRFAVGTASRGLFVTQDGGQTFTQWTSLLDPSADVQSTYRVSALEWNPEHIVVAIPLLGVAVSDDEGASFAAVPFRVPSNLDAENPEPNVPSIEDFATDPSNPDHLAAALNFHGCYESNDGGQTWHNLYGDLNVPNPDPEMGGAWVRSADNVAIVAGSPSTIVLGVTQRGLYRTTNGGVNWTLVATEPGVQPVATAGLQNFAIMNVPGQVGSLAVFEDDHGLLLSDDSGATWRYAASQPALNDGLVMVPGIDAGELTVATWGGGIYQVGGQLALSDTYTSDTSPLSLMSLDIGLSLTFGAGNMTATDQFRVKAQTFQGWAVWRSLESDPDNMVLVGLYDRVNPEDCIEGYCGDDSYTVIPRCFAAKRAACFDFDTPDTVRFFDDEIYNSFGYYYAVTSFDYGNTALSTPENNTKTLVFSPRWQGDAASPYPGVGNRAFIQINEAAAAPTTGDEIYAFPNPVRSGAGFPGDEGKRVTFTNLPAGSRIQVFTVAGDDVIELGSELQVGGQINWNTINRDGEDIAPGVYLYKVEMAQRAAYWGRIVVIR